jgi:hypothetical protein
VVAEIERNFHHWDNCRRLLQGPAHHFRRPWLLRHRAAETAADLPGPRPGTRGQSEIRDRIQGSGRLFTGVRPGHRRRRRQFATRTKYVEHFNPRIDVRKCRFIWLGTKKKLNAFTFAFKETGGAGSTCTPTSSTRNGPPSSSKRRRKPGSRQASTRWSRTSRSPSARNCSPTCSTAPPDFQRPPPARLGRVAQVQPRALRALVQGQHRVAGRRRAHRAFLHRLRHQAGDGGRRGAGQGVEQHRWRRAGASGALPGRARNRGTQAAKRRAQPHDLVRGRRSLRRYGTRPVRLCAAHRQPARRPRQPEAARPGLHRGLRPLVRRALRRADARRRKAAAADVHALQVARHDLGQPRRGLADVHLFGDRRHARRLPPSSTTRHAASAARRW